MLLDHNSSEPSDRLGPSLRARFDPIVVILSPPRCGSTVLARSLWQHRSFRAYLHEPYDLAYYEGRPPSPETILGCVLEGSSGRDQPGQDPATGCGLVLKEMTFQVAGRAAELIEAATLPVILLIRDPRLAVSSRMRCRENDGEDAWFPDREAGWHDLTMIREEMRRSRTDYTVVDISDLRQQPSLMLTALCARLGLPPDEGMLSWPSASGLRLGQLDGRQIDWYQRVLASTEFQRPSEVFPSQGYFRARRMLTVVHGCMRHYRQARTDTHFMGQSGF